MNASWTGYLPEVLREWLDNRKQLQNAIGNTGWLLFDRITRIVIGLTVGAWVARYLGPSQFGELAYILSFVAFFQVVADLQADGFIVRDIAQNQKDTAIILGTALWLRLIAGVIGWLSAIALMVLLHPDERGLIGLTIIVGGTMVFQASDTVDFWFQSQSQSRRTVTAKFVAYLFSNGIRVALLLTKAPLMAFAAVICLESAALALALAIAYRRFPTEQRWRARVAQAKSLLHLCWPFIASGFMITAYMRVDQIMLKEMLGERQLGIYAAALPLSQAWNIIPATLVTSLAPYIARKKVRGEAEYQDALVIIFRLFAVISLSGAAVTALAAPWIIRLMYGAEYHASAIVLSTLVFVIVFGYQGMAQSLWVVNNSVRMAMLVGTTLSAIINLLANAVLIRKFGVLGAVYSCLLAQAASVVIIPCLLRRDLRALYKRAFLGMSRSENQETLSAK